MNLSTVPSHAGGPRGPRPPTASEPRRQGLAHTGSGLRAGHVTTPACRQRRRDLALMMMMAGPGAVIISFVSQSFNLWPGPGRTRPSAHSAHGAVHHGAQPGKPDSQSGVISWPIRKLITSNARFHLCARLRPPRNETSSHFFLRFGPLYFNS